MGRSLSVSDVVEITESEIIKEGFYFCDDAGFKPIEFDAELAEPLAEKRIRVLMVEPGRKAYPKEIGTDLEDIYKAIGCDIFQTVYPSDTDAVCIVCDDEGKINGAKPNRAIRDADGTITDIICGRFFICDCSTECFGSLPDSMMEKYKKRFLLPERFISANGEILAVRYDPERNAAR